MLISLDSIGYAGLVICAPVAIIVICRALAIPTTMKLAVGLVLVLWFVFTALAPLRGAAFGIVLPVLAAPILYRFSSTAKLAVMGAALAPLIALHVTRLLGGLFILLHEEGRLANPFAMIAGWGDILAAVTAVPAAIIAARARPGWEQWVLAWNCLGFADFITAVALGATSQPGSPIQLFFEPPGTALLGQLPWRFIPNYFVPLYLIIHVAIFLRLWPRAVDLQRGREGQSTVS
jgi:hypothetical protein